VLDVKSVFLRKTVRGKNGLELIRSVRAANSARLSRQTEICLYYMPFLKKQKGVRERFDKKFTDSSVFGRRKTSPADWDRGRFDLR
jgi:hypothetical protein